MTCWPVSARIGNVENNDPSLIEPIVVVYADEAIAPSVVARRRPGITGFRYVLPKGNGCGLQRLAWHGMKS